MKHNNTKEKNSKKSISLNICINKYNIIDKYLEYLSKAKGRHSQ